MLIESLTILDYSEKKGTRFDFSNGTNLIVSNGNKKGKSSLLKSIYYALGFDIKHFPSGWNEKNKVFQLEVKFDDRSTHTILRQENHFKIDSDPTPLTVKEYSRWLQTSLGIDMKLPNTNTKKLNSAYSSAVILPFYVDQDDSWDGILYRSVSDSLGQYRNIPKSIFEYLFSISDTDVQELENKINKLAQLIKEKDITISHLSNLLNHYVKEISETPKIVEIDKTQFNKEIKYYLDLVDSYSKKISSYRSKLVKKQKELDILHNDYDELHQLLNISKRRHKEIESECQYCHSKLTREQSLTRLDLKNNEFEIVLLQDSIFKKIENLKTEVMTIQSNQNSLELELDLLHKRIKESKRLSTIDEYINAKAKTATASEMKKVLGKEQAIRIELESEKKSIQDRKRELLKEKGSLREHLKAEFEDIRNQINYSMNLNASDEFSFLQFKKINGSGMDKNTKYLANYLIYISLIEKYSIYKIPFCIDSFIKNEISPDTAEVLFSAIEKYFLPLKNQVFFSIVTDNLQYLKNTDQYNIVQIENYRLNEQNYDLLSTQFFK